MQVPVRLFKVQITTVLWRRRDRIGYNYADKYHEINEDQ